MRRASIPFLLIALVLIAAPVVAGGAECQKAAQAARAAKPCEMTAEECQKWMAEVKQRPWLGVELDIDKAAGTLTVVSVVPDSPAERAGFRAGDRLVALNGVSFGRENEDKLASIKNGLRFGDTATYTVLRDGAEQKLAATLTQMPESVYLAMVDGHKKEHAEVASR
jgi:C-terminal processing protease CtpA/Prc